MAYIGKQPLIGNFQVCDAISTVNNQAAYTLQVGGANVSPETVNNMIVSVNGVIQKPTASYTVAGSTITFTSALVTGDVIDFIQILGSVLDLGTPSDATVTTAKIADGAVTAAKATGFGKIGQIVSTTLTSTVSTTSSTPENLTGLVATITPSATSSKILILVGLTTSHTNQYHRVHFQISGGNAANYKGDAATGNESAMSATHIRAGYSLMSNNMNYLDSPSSTSEIPYQIQWWTEGGTAYVGRPATIDANGGNTASTITVMEVLA